MPGLVTGPVGVGGGKTGDVVDDGATKELDTEVDEPLDPLEPLETELDEAVKVPEVDELGISVEVLDIEDVNETLTLDDRVKLLEIEDTCVEELIEEELLQGTALQSGL